ncbi:ABC transporter ATP-binding protein [Bacillus spongiae]|uniref:ABC transporter ATP-binding protein n=1 Tax=Bacillus spongiae TaxID=2683610 RepID=A0ABU8HGQ0_9BACI
MRKILSYLTSYKASVTIALSLMLFELGVELSQPLLMGIIIDRGIIAGDMEAVTLWGGILLGLSILAFIAGIINTFYSAKVSQGVGYELRRDLFTKTQEVSLTTFKQHSPATLLTRITNDVQSIQVLLFMGLRIMLRAPLFIIGSLLMAFIVYPSIAVLLLISVPILLGIFLLILKKGVNLFQYVQESIDSVNNRIRENLKAMKLVKAFNRGSYESDRFYHDNTSLLGHNTKALKVMEISMPAIMGGMNLILVALIWLGSTEMASGGADAGAIVAVINYGMRILFAFSVFSFLIMHFSRAQASSKRINEIMDQPVSTSKSKQSIDVIHSIAFQNVSYNDETSDRSILQDLSFSLTENQFVGVVGETGSGKTSLLELLPRLYPHSTGEILVNNQPIETYIEADLRRLFGIVPQEAHLFSGSIRDNILWGKKDASDEEVIAAAKSAQIHDFILSLPAGYDSYIGQKGMNLSGGQKQRLSIARALIRKPSVLLLDDSTSALDAETEKRLLEALQEYSCTVVMVAQKLSSIKQSELILLLNEGKIVGKGTHFDLLENNPLYQSIYASQQQGERSRYVQ